MTPNEFEHNTALLRLRLVRQAYSLLKDTDEAEDAVQESLLKLWQMRDRIPDFQKMEHLAMVVVRNSSISLLRKRSRNTSVSLNDREGRYDIASASNAHGIQGNATTPATEQKDTYYLTDRGVAFFYNARIKGRDFKYQPGVNDPNSLPRQDIADEMDALLNRYTKRKGTKKETVSYAPGKTRYNFVTFNSNVNNGCNGYRYIVPNCKESDYAEFRDAMKRHSMTSSVRTSSNDVYWQYEECAICVFIPGSTNPVMVGAALKGTDLYLIRTEGDGCCFLPRAWAEDSPVWDNSNTLHTTGRKALAPPVVK